MGGQRDVETVREHPAHGVGQRPLSQQRYPSLKLLMELLGCTHTELADRSGLSRQTISQLCGPSPKRPSPDTRERIAAGLRECLTPERVL